MEDTISAREAEGTPTQSGQPAAHARRHQRSVSAASWLASQVSSLCFLARYEGQLRRQPARQAPARPARAIERRTASCCAHYVSSTVVPGDGRRWDMLRRRLPPHGPACPTLAPRRSRVCPGRPVHKPWRYKGFSFCSRRSGRRASNLTDHTRGTRGTSAPPSQPQRSACTMQAPAACHIPCQRFQ